MENITLITENSYCYWTVLIYRFNAIQSKSPPNFTEMRIEKEDLVYSKNQTKPNKTKKTEKEVPS